MGWRGWGLARATPLVPSSASAAGGTVRAMINTEAVREKLEQGRAALARLRALADEVERVPLERAADVMTRCWDRMQEIDAEIARVLRGDR